MAKEKTNWAVGKSKGGGETAVTAGDTAAVAAVAGQHLEGAPRAAAKDKVEGGGGRAERVAARIRLGVSREEAEAGEGAGIGTRRRSKRAHTRCRRSKTLLIRSTFLFHRCSTIPATLRCLRRAAAR